MRFRALLALALVPLIGLSGCFAYSNYETVTVQSTSGGAALSGAQCTLTDHSGTWLVTTPGSVSVHLGSEPLVVGCTKQGYQPATIALNSSPNMGAVMLEGPIESTVSGSAWTYPQTISVPMQPAPAAPSAAAAQP